MIKYFLPFVLIACGSKAEDDTSEVNFEDTEEDTEIVEPPAAVLDVEFIGAYGDGVINDSINLAGPVVFSSGDEHYGNFAIVLANEAWLADQNALENYDDACWIIFDLGIAISAESATLDPDFVSGDQWVGWTFSGAETFYAASDSCANVDAQLLPLVEHFKTADFGMGFGAMDSDLESRLADGIGDDWESEYKPYFISQYVSIDFGDFGGPTGWSAVNYARSYQMEEDGTISESGDANRPQVLLDHTDATYAADGYYSGGLYFGWGFGG
ncbi:MAG: hypothetical protein VX278_09775 [Myxococcota bacterium]|nr:hypothetical protein [Myxococcota bacterium]